MKTSSAWELLQSSTRWVIDACAALCLNCAAPFMLKSSCYLFMWTQTILEKVAILESMVMT